MLNKKYMNAIIIVSIAIGIAVFVFSINYLLFSSKGDDADNAKANDNDAVFNIIMNDTNRIKKKLNLNGIVDDVRVSDNIYIANDRNSEGNYSTRSSTSSTNTTRRNSNSRNSTDSEGPITFGGRKSHRRKKVRKSTKTHTYKKR